MNDLIRIADLDHQEQNHLDALIKQWRSKRSRNNLRSAFYDMKNSERSLMAAQVPEVVRRRSFVLGWSAIAVDKLNRRCNLEGFYDAGGQDLAALGLDTLYRDNHLGAEISQAGVSSLMHAVSFIVTTQGDTQAGEAPVLMLGKDATSATGIWDVRRRALGSFLSVAEYDDTGEPVDMTMYLDGLNVTMTKSAGKWTVTRREHSYGVPVDPMRYQPRLGRPMGRSRITRAVMSLHMQALATMIRADVNGEAYSLPRYALLGATEESFRNADGSPKPAWQAAWDAVWAIGDDEDAPSDNLARADVKQFHGQSPEPQNAHLRMIAQMFSGETGVPIGELGLIGDANPTSAEALMASRDDIISEAENTTDGWSPDVGSAVRRGLAMLNRGNIPDGLDIRSQWRSPLHVSRAAAADAGSKIIDKVPWLAETEVGMELLGLTSSQIDRAMNDRRRAQGRQLADALAEAGQSSGPSLDPAALKAQADAMGVLIRAGVSPESAARQVGLPVEFTGAVPVSLRLPEEQSQRIEGR